MNKKILAFVYDGHKFLALRNNPQDPIHGGDFWLTVTGSLHEKETDKEAVSREIKEETNLETKEIFYLNWNSIYSWQKRDQYEKNYIAFVENKPIKLNEENIEYEWLNLKDFITRITWKLDKAELKKVLEKAIKNNCSLNR